MKTISHAREAQSAVKAETNFTIETTFVLFFLAIEFGQSFRFGWEGIFLAATLLAFIALPYFLPSDEKPSFGNWLVGRSLITVFAVGLGWTFKQCLGVVLPETFRFLPTTLLIVSAMLGCYIQFYGFLKLRFVK